MIAGYTLSAKNFDAIVFGYYDGGTIYAGRTRNGFTPAIARPAIQALPCPDDVRGALSRTFQRQGADDGARG